MQTTTSGMAPDERRAVRATGLPAPLVDRMVEPARAREARRAVQFVRTR